MSTTITNDAAEQAVKTDRASRGKRFALAAVAGLLVIAGLLSIGTSSATVNDTKSISGTAQTGTIRLEVDGAAQNAVIDNWDNYVYAPGASIGSGAREVKAAGSLSGLLSGTVTLTGDLAPYVERVKIFTDKSNATVNPDESVTLATLDANATTHVWIELKIADDPAAQDKSVEANLSLVLTADAATPV